MDQTAGPTVPAPQAAVPRAGQAPGSFSDRVPVLAWLIAVAFVAVELAVSGRYGFCRTSCTSSRRADIWRSAT